MFSYQVHSKFTIHPCFHTRLNHTPLEHANIAMCQDIHRSYQQDLLSISRFCSRSETHLQWKRRYEGVHLESANKGSDSGLRRSQRCCNRCCGTSEKTYDCFGIHGEGSNDPGMDRRFVVGLKIVVIYVSLYPQTELHWIHCAFLSHCGK